MKISSHQYTLLNPSSVSFVFALAKWAATVIGLAKDHISGTELEQKITKYKQLRKLNCTENWEGYGTRAFYTAMKMS
jgi:hypothetical protein